MTPASIAPPAPLALTRASNLGRSGPVLSWTPLGTLDAGAVADVDDAGLVQVRGTTWSLDWWVGAEDRWHHPSVEAAVRQHPVGDAPVVETAMRVPGGDVVHRAYGVQASSDGPGGVWNDAGVVVEVENSTAVPVALAFVVRPVGLSGSGALSAVESDGAVVRVDGRVAFVLSRPPARAAHGSPGAVAELLSRGEDVDGAAVSVTGRGDAEVAFVFPLPHTATVRVLLPRPAEPVRRGLLRPTRPGAAPGPTWTAPDADAVVSGWDAHTRDAARVELPEPLLDQALRASQRSLVVAAGDGFLGETGPTGREAKGDAEPTAAVRAAHTCELLARSGLVEPLEPLARALVASQRLGGSVRLADGSDATVALVHAAAPLLATGAPGWVEDLLGPVAKAVHRLGKDDATEAGALTRSAVDALARIAPALRSIDQPEVADEAQRLATELAGRTAAFGDGSPGGGVGGSTAAAAATVRAQLASGADGAVASLVELARLGAPGALADRTDGDGIPSGRTGFDAAAVAARAGAVLDAALVEGPDGPVILPAWPTAWWGQPVEAHGVRTRWGVASFGLRWHGERPALLWEVEPYPDTGHSTPAPVLTAPALDPSWRAEGWSGDALLSPVPVPDTLVSIRSAVAAEDPAPRAAAPASPPPAEGQSFS